MSFSFVEIKNFISRTQNKLFLIPATISILFYLFNDGWQIHDDSIKYIYTSETVQNGEGYYHANIMLRPGAVYISVILSFLGSENSYGIQNAFFLVMISPLMYFYSKRFVKDESLALYSSVFLVSSFPVLYWGLCIGNDMGSWFLTLLSFHLIIKTFENDLKIKDITIVAIVLGLAILYKTSAISVCLFFALYLFFIHKDISFNSKIRIFLFFGFLTLIPVFFNQLYLWNTGYEVSYWNNFLKPLLPDFLESLISDSPSNTTGTGPFGGNASELQSSTFYSISTFFIAFPLLPLVFWNIKNISKLTLERDEKQIFIAFLVATMFLIIGYNIYSPRFSFLLFPIIIPLTILSLERVFDILSSSTDYFVTKKTLWVFFLVVYFSINFFVAVNSEDIREALGFWVSDPDKGFDNLIFLD